MCLSDSQAYVLTLSDVLFIYFFVRVCVCFEKRWKFSTEILTVKGIFYGVQCAIMPARLSKLHV